MNRMTPEARIVHARLEAWAKWSRDHINSYPPRTLLGRIIEEGANGASSTSAPVYMPEAIAVTDQAVMRLPIDDRRIVTEYYQRWESWEVLAKRFATTERDLQRTLERSRIRIAAYVEILQDKFERAL